MTKEQFEHIQGLLEEWRAVRNLSVEDQKKNFKVNYTKELLEFFEAERDGNEYEMVDAICDMIVLSLNAGAHRGHSYYGYTNENLVAPLTVNYIEVRGLLFELENRGYDSYLCLLETVKELESRSGSWNEKEGKWCKDKGAYSKDELNEELVKNICQEDDDYWYYKPKMGGVLGKVKKWYKADYAKCKLEVENV